MPATSALLPSPPSLSTDMLSEPASLIATADASGESVLVGFDPGTRTGALYHQRVGLWTLFGPLSGFAQWLAFLHGRGVSIPDTADSRRWLAACSESQSPMVARPTH